jgi:hypothetical protein
MKIISLRKLARDAPDLTEAVLVLHNRRAIGQFTPMPSDDQIPVIDVVAKAVKSREESGGTAMPEEPIRKELAKEAPKVDQSGQLRKGLGPLPGEDPNKSYREFRPVPKPKK